MKKAFYILGITVISLICLTVFSTYALFSETVESGNVLNLDTTLQYDFTSNSTKTFTIGAMSELHFNAVVINNLDDSAEYGIYHNFKLTSTSDVKIGEVVDDSSSTTSSPNGTGTLVAGASKPVTIAIVNNKEEDITVTLGVVTSASNITLSSGQYLLQNTIDVDELSEKSCAGNVGYNEETCYEESIDGIIYTRCNIIVSEEEIENLDDSGVNTPDLIDGMIAVYHNGSAWIKADSNNADANYQWYDYNAKKWANAVLVSSSSRNTYMSADLGTTISESDILAYYVWIPRYKYQLFNVDSASMSPIEIQINFENNTDTTGIPSTTPVNGEWLTHPAFTFGEDELRGFWVGKFETTGDATTPTVKPSLQPLVSQKISTQFTTSQKFATSTYLTATGVTQADAHLMKNTEWGAVAYLKQSKYGLGTTDIGINAYREEYYDDYDEETYLYYKTGCGNTSNSTATASCNAYNTTTGMLASTTGNVFGIYDMSGGVLEHTLGGMLDSAGTSWNDVYSGGFTTSNLPPNSKYVNVYAYGTTVNDATAYSRKILGDATGEVNGWYGDYVYMVNSASDSLNAGSWFARSGFANGGITASYYGIFYAVAKSGVAIDNTGFRTTIAKIG